FRCAGEHLDQGVRLGAVGGEDPPRSTAVEGGGHFHLTGRQQRGGHRVPGVAGQLSTVEAGPQQSAAKYPPAVYQPQPTGSPSDPSERNSLVAVLRTTVNQRRQPAVCTQRSRNSPAGLSRMNR